MGPSSTLRQKNGKTWIMMIRVVRFRRFKNKMKRKLNVLFLRVIPPSYLNMYYSGMVVLYKYFHDQ